jgi:uncharacterized protein (DUF433 family)
MEAKAYVEHHEGGYWVAGTRVSLDSLVYAFRDGQTAESLAQSFPVLTLEQVYGAIAYYLANHAVIDAYESSPLIYHSCYTVSEQNRRSVWQGDSKA